MQAINKKTLSLLSAPVNCRIPSDLYQWSKGCWLRLAAHLFTKITIGWSSDKVAIQIFALEPLGAVLSFNAFFANTARATEYNITKSSVHLRHQKLFITNYQSSMSETQLNFINFLNILWIIITEPTFIVLKHFIFYLFLFTFRTILILLYLFYLFLRLYVSFYHVHTMSIII